MQPTKKNILLYLNTGALAIFIIIALSFYIRTSRSAAAMAEELKLLGNEYIEYVVTINDTIPLVSNISISNEAAIALDMQLRHALPIKLNQHIRDSFSLPVRLHLSQILHVDTSLSLSDSLQLFARGSIPVDQKFAMLGMDGFKIRTKATIPLQQVLNVKMLHRTNYVSDIPVRLDIDEQIPVALNLNVPIEQVVPLELPIKSTAKVSFPEQLHIVGMIPVKMEVPIRIPLAETPLKKHLDKAADHLSDMF
ncbi:MAG: hypothetical protein EOP56_05630 [Sphingobacteriales bacterium]|nr:MAG: hypothetical protein EOP56_05630 [Sphingobacteriales bacterium]